MALQSVFYRRILLFYRLLSLFYLPSTALLFLRPKRTSLLCASIISLKMRFSPHPLVRKRPLRKKNKKSSKSPTPTPATPYHPFTPKNPIHKFDFFHFCGIFIGRGDARVALPRILTERFQEGIKGNLRHTGHRQSDKRLFKSSSSLWLESLHPRDAGAALYAGGHKAINFGGPGAAPPR